MRTTNTKSRKQLKDKLIGMKLDASVVERIDTEANSEGLTRSAIIRRILIRNYAEASQVPAHS